MKVRYTVLVLVGLALFGCPTLSVFVHGADDGQAPPDAAAPLNLVPLVIEKTATIRATAFDAKGQSVGHRAGDIFYLHEVPK